MVGNDDTVVVMYSRHTIFVRLTYSTHASHVSKAVAKDWISSWIPFHGTLQSQLYHITV